MCQKLITGSWNLNATELNLWELLQDLSLLKECATYYAAGVNDQGSKAKATINKVKPRFFGYDFAELRTEPE